MFGAIILVSILLSIFSTSVMCYISMATPIGPWIAPTLVLCALLLFNLFARRVTSTALALATSAGSIGGIMATAFGFSYPALYFLDPGLFNAWMMQPIFFATVISALAFIGGGLGIWIADWCEDTLLVKEQLAFPIGQLVYKTILAMSNQMRKAYELVIGFAGTMVFCILQDGVMRIQSFIPKSLMMVDAMKIGFISIPSIKLDLFPLVWAIGFVTGHVIALPLAVGAVSRILFLDPLHRTIWFCHLTSMEFILAFCSGMILIGAVTSFIGLPKQMWRGIKKMKSDFDTGTMLSGNGFSRNMALEFGCLLILFICFFSYFEFSWLAQLYMLVSTIICAYQIAAIAGRIGMALVGRYATFVMVPGMLLFGFNAIQLVLISTLVEICGGVTTDVLFGRKLAQLAGIDRSLMKRYQYFGLIISSLIIGIVFWLLVSHFQLGSDQLFAQKAQGRQLLVAVRQFDVYVLLIGALFGFLLQKIKVNPALVFGGLLMPINLVVGLVLGGLCTMCTSDKEEWFPFWSGVYAANSIWMLLQAIIA